MKRIPALIMAVSMLFTMTACGQKPAELVLGDMKTAFEYGEEFTVGGLQVTLVEDGKQTVLSADEYTVDTGDFDKNAAGTYTITVSAKERNIQKSYEVTVAEAKAPLSLTLSGQKRQFEAGEDFDPGNLSVIVTYADGNSKILSPEEYSIDSSRFQKNVAGQYTITVRTVDGKIAKDYIVTVITIPVSLAVTGQKTSFEIYEKFTVGAATVTAAFSDGKTRVLDEDEYEVDTGDFVRGAIGTYTVTIAMRSARHVKASYSVEVVPGDYAPFSDGIKVLAIGNSFSRNAMRYLYDIFDDLGIENITVVNLYVSGCALDRHASIARNGTASYDHEKNTDGTWKTLGKISTADAIKSEAWDYIITQQASGYSGRPDTYNEDLDYLLQFIQERKLPETKLVWHMTWAYQSDSTHKHFAFYDNDQTTMYNAIIGATQGKIVPKIPTDIGAVIPSGTAIQNMRTSFVGDTLTADGYHLKNEGCYIAGLAWAKKLTGWPIDAVGYVPQDAPIDAAFLAAAKEAVINADATPYAVTRSTYATRP